jgi:hypothetical protein
MISVSDALALSDEDEERAEAAEPVWAVARVEMRSMPSRARIRILPFANL